MSEACDQAAEHWEMVWRVFDTGFEEVLGHDIFPRVVVLEELVFEKVYPSTLVVALAEELAVVMLRNLSRRILPRFEIVMSGYVVVDGVEVMVGAAKEVGRAEEMR